MHVPHSTKLVLRTFFQNTFLLIVVSNYCKLRARARARARGKAINDNNDNGNGKDGDGTGTGTDMSSVNIYRKSVIILFHELSSSRKSYYCIWRYYTLFLRIGNVISIQNSMK